MPARTRSRSTRVLGAVAAALTSAALLAACGSDDSTATSTPSATTSAAPSESAAEPTTSAATSAEATPSGDTATPRETTSGAAETSPGEAATAPPPEAQPAPDARDEAFLAALREEGVDPGNEAGAIGIANYICGAEAQGGAPEEIKTFVTALVGSESVASGTEITEEQASATADTYITVARDTYCS